MREVCFSLLYEMDVVASFQIRASELLRISFLRGRTPRHWVICSRGSETATLSANDGDRLSSEAVPFPRRTEQSPDTSLEPVFGTGLVKDRLHLNLVFTIEIFCLNLLKLKYIMRSFTGCFVCANHCLTLGEEHRLGIL